MSGRTLRRGILFGLALAALAACGLKGDPVPPETDEAQAAR